MCELELKLLSTAPRYMYADRWRAGLDRTLEVEADLVGVLVAEARGCVG